MVRYCVLMCLCVVAASGCATKPKYKSVAYKDRPAGKAVAKYQAERDNAYWKNIRALIADSKAGRTDLPLVRAHDKLMKDAMNLLMLGRAHSGMSVQQASKHAMEHVDRSYVLKEMTASNWPASEVRDYFPMIHRSLTEAGHRTSNEKVKAFRTKTQEAWDSAMKNSQR